MMGTFISVLFKILVAFDWSSEMSSGTSNLTSGLGIISRYRCLLNFISP